MNTLSWNFCGVGGPRKRRFLDRILRATKADIAFVTETKCSLEKSKRFLRELPLPNWSYVPARGRAGCLWLMWSENITL